jgi:heat shock protein HslJ
MRHLTRFLALTVLVAACNAMPAATLDGTEWLSIEVTEDGEERPLVPGTQIRLRFEDGQVGASAGCNTIGGTYRLDDGRLVFEGGGMTEMGCDNERHAQDDWLAAFLGSRPTVAREGSELTLSSGTTVVVLQDREVADPDLPLTGTTWTVESLITGDAVSTIPGDAVATFAFADDGTVDLNTGCNTGGGSYEVLDGALRFGDLVITDRACDGPAGELEAAVLEVIGPDLVTYQVEAASLTLMAGDVGLGLRGD